MEARAGPAHAPRCGGGNCGGPRSPRATSSPLAMIRSSSGWGSQRGELDDEVGYPIRIVYRASGLAPFRRSHVERRRQAADDTSCMSSPTVSFAEMDVSADSQVPVSLIVTVRDDRQGF